jgi:hypothetical protein
MNSRWFNTVVVMLWLATMGWLVEEKVLPPLLFGEPPSYRSIVEAQQNAPPVGWRVSLNGHPLGWALTDTQLQSTGLTEIRGRVHFTALPLAEMMPSWLRSLAGLNERSIGPLQMDARSLLAIDPLGHLVRFDSTARVDPLNEVISVQGIVEGRRLQLLVRAGNEPLSSEAYLPSDALLCDALSPQMQLPGLRAGQTWTVPVYNPLWLTKTPLEIIRATVEGTEPILWNGAIEDAWLVMYRNDSGSGAGNNQSPRGALCGTLWVRRNGTVLKQQVVLLGATVTFVRLPDEKAAALVKAVGPQWWIVGEQPAGSQP